MFAMDWTNAASSPDIIINSFKSTREECDLLLGGVIAIAIGVMSDDMSCMVGSS